MTLTLTDLPERIRSRIDFDGPVPQSPSRPVEGGCWLWTGGTFPAGYGSVWIDGQNRLLHQVVFELTVGRRSDRSQFIDHICRVRRCCNPAHLELVTPLGNMLSAQRETCSRGHEFTSENTSHPRGKPTQRRCKACAAQRQRESYARKKESGQC
ncbi:HNH endonuclease [Gordonia phage Matteo]|uniref:HNH endonuclease n=1 Tax=Gordonia phage Matteo TaxID=2759392 RepID=A0A7L7SHS2_9CAUD|nr:HNH endonuclease [Gordonia phage Matteo]QOC55983.1 HNH endonuclease [Gordonia phage Matteo]